MEKTLEMAILERSTAKAAVEKWNQEYEMFMQNVDEKIQQQKDTYNELERKIGQLALFSLVNSELCKCKKVLQVRYCC